jgi:NitT/TauT family transport system substrate-binding protein
MKPFLATAALAALAASTLAAQGGPWTLKVGIMPDADSLPLMVAEAEGRFAAEGVFVSLVPFKSPIERDAAFQAGAVDGIIGDSLAAALAVQGGFAVRIASLTDGRYGLVAAPGSGIDSPARLKGLPIGVSTNTIIQYAVDSFMTKAGVARPDIVYLAIPKMPLRLEMVVSGQVKAAALPEPLLTVAQVRGARLLAASDDSGLNAGVLIFSKRIMDERLAELSLMYRAYWKAARAINAFLAEKAGFPEEARTAYRFVRYARPRLPAEADVAAVLSWMRAVGLLEKDLRPSDLLDGRAIDAAAGAPGW